MLVNIMRDINKIRKKFEKCYAQNCIGHKDISQCQKGDKCECKLLAEVQAYIYSVIGDPYYKFTIWDFDGRSSNWEKDKLMNINILLEAKEKILKYCWKDVGLDTIAEFENDRKSLDLDSKSIIDTRRKEGTNIVIYAPSDESPKGKTFVASLVMREAIKRRALPGRSIDTYNWIKFPSLWSLISNDSDRVESSLKFCDWLVVDDIPSQSGAKRTMEYYITSKMDPFFIERIEDGLPTILVFRFDVTSNTIRWEEQFGIGISSIVKDPNTFTIRLGE